MIKILSVIALVVCALVILRRGIPGFFVFRGYALQDRGQLEAAEKALKTALRIEQAIKRLTGERAGIAHVAAALGSLHHQQRRVDDATAMYQQAIDIFTTLQRLNEAAPVYSSLGKLYFDIRKYGPAEEVLNQALAIYSRRPDSREAIKTITALLDLIAERRGGIAIEATTYENAQFGFSITIPSGWVTSRQVDQFARPGGQIAISHSSHAASCNVSVGPLDRPEWTAVDIRAAAAREFLSSRPERVGSIDISTAAALAGEVNTVTAEYTMKDGKGAKQRRHGFLSVVHNGLEYNIQWAAEPDYEEQTRSIINSFKFRK